MKKNYLSPEAQVTLVTIEQNYLASVDLTTSNLEGFYWDDED